MDMWMTIGLVAVVGVVFYFFILRPQKKQEKQAADMRNNLSVGDEITTIGGIIGKVVSIKEETMVIETTRDHTRIRLLKSAVRTVDVPANAKVEAPKKDEAKKEEVKDAAPKKKSKKAAKAAEAPVEEAVDTEATEAAAEETKA